MVALNAAIRRLRNLINDRPYGFSTSAQNPSTDLSAIPAPSLRVKLGEGVGILEITFSNIPSLTTGSAVAFELQEQIRASSPELIAVLATVTFSNGLYTIKSGTFGTDSTVEVLPATTGDDVASFLLLGQQFGGTEGFEPNPRYSNEQIEQALRFGVVQYNANAPDHLKVCSLEEAVDPALTIILYYAWMLLLEGDAGSTVYSFRQKLGGDELALTDIHRNILDYLKYLRDRIRELEEDIGVSQVLLGELTRYDRERNFRVPTYIKTAIAHPRFLQIKVESPGSLLVEWNENRVQDFALATLYVLDDPALSPMVDKARLTSNTQHKANAIIDEAEAKIHTSVPINTVGRVSGLALQVYHIVLVFMDTRGQYYWSNEYSIDLSDSDSQPVLVVDNNPNVDPTAPTDALC